MPWIMDMASIHGCASNISRANDREARAWPWMLSSSRCSASMGKKAEERGNEWADKRVPQDPCLSVDERGSRGTDESELGHGLAR